LHVDHGIGRAVAIAFAREGADVAIAYRNEHDDAKKTKQLVDYASTKGAIVALTRSLLLMLAEKGIRVNGVEPAPADENARALWWAIKLMRDNGFVPDEVRLRKAIDQLKSDLARANTAPSIRALAESINGLVRKLNTMGTTALHTPVAAIDIPAELRARGFEPS
jgi:NAD(P)-dependent dehydrogenase (short-subunit alcohol dehydrogenase family)